MPVENERKYIIHEGKGVEEIFKIEAEKFFKIEQKYLSIGKGFSVRVRKSIQTARVPGIKFESEIATSYSMTVKKNVGAQVVEIETRISEADFNKLWPTAFNKVMKFRYIYNGWEVDFFKDANQANYFGVAEIELPVWQREPRSIPDLINKQIIYPVPIEDKRFSNKKLGNVGYAINLLKVLKSAPEEKFLKRKVK